MNNSMIKLAMENDTNIRQHVSDIEIVRKMKQPESIRPFHLVYSPDLATDLTQGIND